MKDCKDIWLRMDHVGRIIFLSGTVSALFFLAIGKGIAAVGTLLLTLLSCVLYGSVRTRRLLLYYGTLCYTMPDGEVVEVALSDVLREPKRYVNRAFMLCCPYDGKNADGDYLTPFGLTVDVSGCETLPDLRRGAMMRVYGTLQKDGGTVYLQAHSCAMG